MNVDINVFWLIVNYSSQVAAPFLVFAGLKVAFSFYILLFVVSVIIRKFTHGFVKRYVYRVIQFVAFFVLHNYISDELFWLLAGSYIVLPFSILVLNTVNLLQHEVVVRLLEEYSDSD